MWTETYTLHVECTVPTCSAEEEVSGPLHGTDDGRGAIRNRLRDKGWWFNFTASEPLCFCSKHTVDDIQDVPYRNCEICEKKTPHLKSSTSRVTGFKCAVCGYETTRAKQLT